VTGLQADGFEVQIQRQSDARAAGVVFGQGAARDRLVQAGFGVVTAEVFSARTTATTATVTTPTATPTTAVTTPSTTSTSATSTTP
jgi:hypothetical protein